MFSRTDAGLGMVRRMDRTLILGLALVACASVALMACAARASADVNGVPYGSTTDVRPGSHGDLTVGSDFTYSSPSEDLRRVEIDLPTGGVGNPNAIPYADRCTKAQFATSTCGAASQIGVVTLQAIVTVLACQPVQCLSPEQFQSSRRRRRSQPRSAHTFPPWPA